MYQFHFVNEKENEIIGTASKTKMQKHNKTFKEVLKNKEEMSKFLKHFIGLEVKASELQIYNNEFINDKYEKRISDIIYKNKEKDIYYLLEHQSKVDLNMPQRILEYCIELMKEVKKNQNLKYHTNLLIVPIVIYTRMKKWTVSENFSDTQKVEERYKEYAINLKYKLIDINKYSKEELTNKNTKMTSMMLLEKCINQDETIEAIIKLWKIYGKEKIPMEDWIERMKASRRRENRELRKKAIKEGRQEGIKETIRLIAKNMLKENQDENTIMRYTNVDRQEIEEIRRELEAS